MHYLYRQLCRDHHNMQLLLDAVERLLADLDRRDRSPSTLSLILDALDYISVYPDRWHHPLEDLAMARLMEKSINCSAEILTVREEHKAIAAATSHTAALFYAVANDVAVERSQLLRAAENYLELQRQHMQRENTHIFPQLEQLLTEEDWRKIGRQLRRQQDPLFGTPTRKLYESLHAYVTAPPERLCT
ncbi:hemerythrin domain-containing protein [Microbulbifer sp. TYP-18]|uniref:hemerythrin domain-containing protein n=1 Tax=Microbulbifer sp. TYP-18 TaxID=3230024 RepID=UPI0034C6CB9D